MDTLLCNWVLFAVVMSSSTSSPYSYNYAAARRNPLGQLGGRVQQCDARNACPAGYACLWSRSFLGVRACYPGAANGQKRPGVCPSVGSINAVAQWCQFDGDCAPNLRCCPAGAGTACLAPRAVSLQPIIKILSTGAFRPISTRPGAFETSTTVGLVQSNGKNILFDSGGPNDRVMLLNALQQQGLYPDDIDMLVTSHGHADHYANMNMFADSVNSISAFVYEGTKLVFNPLGRQQVYHPLGDPNLEIQLTGGHTNQDTILIVRNATGYGTVIFAGDLILNQNQFPGDPGTLLTEQQLSDAQRNILCTADYVAPGHGPVFQVTQDFRTTNSINC